MRFTRLKEFGEYLIIELFGGNLWMKLSMEISVEVQQMVQISWLQLLFLLLLTVVCVCLIGSVSLGIATWGIRAAKPCLGLIPVWSWHCY